MHCYHFDDFVLYITLFYLNVYIQARSTKTAVLFLVCSCILRTIPSFCFLNRTDGYLFGYTGAYFGYQLLGWVVISAWSFACSMIIYGVLKAFKILRTDLKTEIVGYDFIEFADDYELQSSELIVRPKEDHSKAEDQHV